MVQIIWSKEALFQLKRHLEYSYIEFGNKTMNKFIKEVEGFEKRLQIFPESYKPVPELSDLSNFYRGCTVMKNFLLIPIRSLIRFMLTIFGICVATLIDLKDDLRRRFLPKRLELI